MKRLPLAMLAITVAGAATLSFFIVSCDNNAADPQTPGNSRGGVKGAHVQSESSANTIGIDRASVESGGQLSLDQETAVLSVANYNESGGLSSTPQQAANTWSQRLGGAWPSTGDGGIRFTARSGDDIASTLEVAQVAGSATHELSAVAVFTGTGHPPVQTVTWVIRHCDGSVEYVTGVPATQAVTLEPPNQECCDFLQIIDFDVIQSPLLGRCVWTMMWNKCCCFRVFVNGQWYESVLGVTVRQVLSDGPYPYQSISEIRSEAINGGVSGTLDVLSEVAMNVPSTP